MHALSRAVAFFSEAKVNGSPRSWFNVGLIDGGTSINSIPSLARAKVDIRSESNEKMDELVALLNAAVERAQEQENQRATGGKVTAKSKNRCAASRGTGSADAGLQLHPRRRCLPWDPFASRLFFHRCQHSAFPRHSRDFDRNRRPRRRRPHCERMV